jgi:N-acetylmuramoyl-L-alanine amidase
VLNRPARLGAAMTVLVLGATGCAAASGPANQPAARPASPAASADSPVAATASPTTRAAGAAPARPLRGKVIAIDPGHNGANWSHPQVINRLVNVITETKPCDTTGTQTDAGYAEHAFTFNVAKRLARLLRREGATVVLTRHNDQGVGPCVTHRAAIGNRAHADAAISIHADGGPPGGVGFDVIEPGLVPGHTGPIVKPSALLGRDIRAAYHRITHEPFATYVGHDGLDVRTDLGGLNLSTVPKVFIECGNMRNASDAAKLSRAAFRQRIAVALAAGFTRFL